MNWKTWLLLFLALAAGCVASFGVKTAFFTEKNAQTDAKVDDLAPKERLLVANGALPAGTELNAQNVRLTLTSEQNVPRDGIFAFDGISGRKTNRDLKDGEAISLFDLEASEESRSEDVSFIPPGRLVVPIQICSASKATGGVNFLKTTKLSNLVKVGDVVDLVVVKQDPSSNSKRRLISESVVENVSVFAVRDENRFTSEGVARNSILSALLSKEQIESVRKASEEGKIKVVFRSVSDLSNEELNEQNDFLSGDFYASIKNNDAALDRSSDDVQKRPQAFNDSIVEDRDDVSGLLTQDDVPLNDNLESVASKGEKNVLMNVSRKVEIDEPNETVLTDGDDLSTNGTDDVLSCADVIVGDENAEKTDDLPTEEPLEDNGKDEAPPFESPQQNSVEKRDQDEKNLSSNFVEFSLPLENDSDERLENDVVPKGVEIPLPDFTRPNDEGAQEEKGRPRVFSPYATRGTNESRRRVPKF